MTTQVGTYLTSHNGSNSNRHFLCSKLL